ncbi:MAG TPA: C4-dicarboxylate ABC transporter substrate-binding protein, partial [Gammaproteobacteria bacterium]|nr:C4-dicarboxylate ABC transporter substrate-binding protein [Gammaproteobacteria bacterium]
HEVAPYITLVGLGGQLTGGMSINLDTWNSLPQDIRNVLDQLGEEYSVGVADELGVRYERGLQSMQAEGATVTELPYDEKLKWLDGLPNIARRWAEATEARGIPALEVLGIYMDAVRARGGTPLRDWDHEE